MIKNLQVSDLVEIFQDIPIYVGDEEGGEIIFKKGYHHGLSLTLYLDIYGEKIEIIISCPEYPITTFSSRIERVEIHSDVIHFICCGQCLAELQIEPSPFLKVHGCSVSKDSI